MREKQTEIRWQHRRRQQRRRKNEDENEEMEEPWGSVSVRRTELIQQVTVVTMKTINFDSSVTLQPYHARVE